MAGGLRSQFAHVIDVAPTVSEVAGIPAPRTVDGIEQELMHGASFVGSLVDDAALNIARSSTSRRSATAPCKGWLVAGDEDGAHPWVLTPDALKPYAPGVWDPDAGPAELYFLPDDFTQATDLASQHPEKVQELKDLFWEEAERYKVLPLLATLSTFSACCRRSPDRRRSSSAETCRT